MGESMLFLNSAFRLKASSWTSLRKFDVSGLWRFLFASELSRVGSLPFARIRDVGGSGHSLLYGLIHERELRHWPQEVCWVSWLANQDCIWHRLVSTNITSTRSVLRMLIMYSVGTCAITVYVSARHFMHRCWYITQPLVRFMSTHGEDC